MDKHKRQVKLVDSCRHANADGGMTIKLSEICLDIYIPLFHCSDFLNSMLCQLGLKPIPYAIEVTWILRFYKQMLICANVNM